MRGRGNDRVWSAADIGDRIKFRIGPPQPDPPPGRGGFVYGDMDEEEPTHRRQGDREEDYGSQYRDEVS